MLHKQRQQHMLEHTHVFLATPVLLVVALHSTPYQSLSWSKLKQASRLPSFLILSSSCCCCSCCCCCCCCSCCSAALCDQIINRYHSVACRVLTLLSSNSKIQSEEIVSGYSEEPLSSTRLLVTAVMRGLVH